jgi:F0F1-type ATP synthase assembly protein I
VARSTPSSADVVMRRLLRVPHAGPKGSEAAARNAFSASIWISTIRCLLTYIVLPVLGPALGLSGAVGPVLGLVVGTVSAVAVVISMRRFWAADHRWRWGYTAVGGGILVLLAVQAVGDVIGLVA